MKNWSANALRRFTIVLCMMVVAFSSCSLETVFAITSQDANSMANNTAWYDPSLIANCTANPNPVATTVTDVAGGGPNVKIAFEFFVANGFTAQQAAGIVGNLQQEASATIDPTIVNPDGGAYGIAQWLGSRYTGLVTWVESENGQYTTLGGQKGKPVGQLNYVIEELDTDYATVATAMKKITGTGTAAVNQAADTWNLLYEGSGDSNTPRENYADTVYKDALAGNWTGTAGGVAGSGTATTGSVSSACAGVVGGSTTTPPDCKAAATTTGDAKILAEAECHNGIWYEWGGGHQGYAAYNAGCPNPQDPPDNNAHGGAVDGDPAGVSGNPSPCATDCSGLVDIAVAAAFGQDFTGAVSGIEDETSYWTEIQRTAVEPGDIVVIGTDHVEIVDHYDANTNTLYTFGSHYTGAKTSEATTVGYDPAGGWGGWTAAYRYTIGGVK
jgi:hypothetical protein